ncbi:MAG: hypothetical protein AAF288_01030 [Planctomycetota bacterium]
MTRRRTLVWYAIAALMLGVTAFALTHTAGNLDAPEARTRAIATYGAALALVLFGAAAATQTYKRGWREGHVAPPQAAYGLVLHGVGCLASLALVTWSAGKFGAVMWPAMLPAWVGWLRARPRLPVASDPPSRDVAATRPHAAP